MSTTPPRLPRTGELRRTTDTAPTVVADLTRNGFAVGHVRASDKAAFLAAVGPALRLPSWYGRNLDALWDCLTDLTRPTALVWTGWEDLAVTSPDDWARVLRVLSERVRAEPAFTVVLAAPDDARRRL